MYVTQEEHVKDMKHMQELINDIVKRLNDYTDDIHKTSTSNIDYISMMAGINLDTAITASTDISSTTPTESGGTV